MSDYRRATDDLIHKPHQKLHVAIIKQVYEDLFLQPERDSEKFNSKYAADWLFSDAHKKSRERAFDLAGVSQEALNREVLKGLGRLITRNTV